MFITTLETTLEIEKEKKMTNIKKKGALCLQKAAISALLGGASAWISISTYHQVMLISALTFLVACIAVPLIIMNAVEAAIYFSRAAEK